MELRVLGTGRPYNSERHKGNTCFILDCGRRLLIDTPSEWSTYDSAGIAPATIDGVVLTHLHWDHAGGLDAFLMYKKFNPSEKGKPTLYTTKEIYDGLLDITKHTICRTVDSQFKPRHIGLHEYVDFKELKSGHPFEEGGLKIEARSNLHSVPAIGLKISDGNRTFAYSGDTNYDPELIARLHKQFVPLLVIEPALLV